MKKEPSRPASPGNGDFSLPRKKILRGRRNFQRLFESSTVLRSPSVHFRYRIYDDAEEGCLIGFIVKTKLGHAVKRNRIKRLLREVYRRDQHLLSDLFEKKEFGFHGAFIAQKRNLTYESLAQDMIPMLKRVRHTLTERLGLVNSVDHNRNSR